MREHGIRAALAEHVGAYGEVALGVVAPMELAAGAPRRGVRSRCALRAVRAAGPRIRRHPGELADTPSAGGWPAASCCCLPSACSGAWSRAQRALRTGSRRPGLSWPKSWPPTCGAGRMSRHARLSGCRRTWSGLAERLARSREQIAAALPPSGGAGAAGACPRARARNERARALISGTGCWRQWPAGRNRARRAVMMCLRRWQSRGPGLGLRMSRRNGVVRLPSQALTRLAHVRRLPDHRHRRTRAPLRPSRQYGHKGVDE